MLGYYFNLALRSFRNSRVLTALMVLAIALGIGACMTTLTVFRVLSGDPIPDKSDRLFYVQLDPRSARGAQPGEDPETQLTRFDAETLLAEAKGLRQAMMTSGSVSVTPERTDLPPFFAPARYTSRDFFAMFAAPFQYGAGWSGDDDAGSARVAVISRSLNERVFGGENSVGRSLMLGGNEFRVAGVLDAWRPTPRFWDMYSQTFGDGVNVQWAQLGGQLPVFGEAVLITEQGDQTEGCEGFQARHRGVSMRQTSGHSATAPEP